VEEGGSQPVNDHFSSLGQPGSYLGAVYGKPRAASSMLEVPEVMKMSRGSADLMSNGAKVLVDALLAPVGKGKKLTG
jgi:hypothetical protein